MVIVLAAPPAEGVNWVLLTIALGILGAGGLSLLLFFQNQKRRKLVDSLRERKSVPAPPSQTRRDISGEHKLDMADLRRAYDAAMRDRDYMKAASLALRMKDASRQAEAYERAGDVERAVAAWVEAREVGRAATLLEGAGQHAKAARLYQQAGAPDEAIALYLKIGQVDKAIPLIRQQGDEIRARRMEGDLAKRQDNRVEAARHYIAAGAFLEAAEVLVTANEPLKAAEAYRRASRPLDAARLLLASGDQRQAAQLFEEGGALVEAARIWEVLGDAAARERCLARSGNSYEAGRAAFERGDLDAALRFFDAVPPLDDQYHDAGLFRGQILERQGRQQDAAEAYLVFLKTRSVNPKTVMLFTRVARLLEAVGQGKQALRILGRIITAGLGSSDITGWAERLERTGDDSIATESLDEEAAAPPKRALPETPPAQKSPPAKSPFPGRMEIDDAALSVLERRYKLGDRMGQGGNGVVYLATDKALGREVVVKFLHQALLPTDVARKYFTREAKVAASLSHQNIVTIYDIGTEGETLYYCMEWVKGKTLADLVIEAGGRLGHEAIVPIISQFCDALEYAHDRQVIHRDIKPGNVMVTTEGKVKLLDFGLAKALDENPDKSVFLCGTPYYMSPEQITRGFLDHRTDIYSLGCMLYVMYTGDVPFPDGNVFHQHQTAAAPDPVTRVPGLKPGVSAALMKCIAKDRNERFQRATEVARALSAA